MSQCNTLRPDNQFQFECPIFKATVELRSCFKVHDKKMRGERLEVRKGCQAAMASSKCPVWHIEQYLRRGEDPYFSATPKVGKLDDKIIERIERIQTSDKTIVEYAATTKEAELLVAANSMWGSNEVKKPRKAGKKDEAIEMAPVPVAAAPERDESDALVSAAARGDLSAAISKAAHAENEGGGSVTPKTTKRPSASPARAA